METLFVFIVMLATAGASAAHGSDSWTKWAIAGVHALVIAIAAWICLPSDLVATPVIAVATSLVYWLLFRGGAQARAELDTLHTPTPANFKRLWVNYLLPVGVCLVPVAFGILKSWSGVLIVGAGALVISIFTAYAVLKVTHYETPLGKKLMKLAPGGAMNRRASEVATALAPGGLGIGLAAIALSFIFV